jgi:hypothetical protein
VLVAGDHFAAGIRDDLRCARCRRRHRRGDAYSLDGDFSPGVPAPSARSRSSRSCPHRRQLRVDLKARVVNMSSGIAIRSGFARRSPGCASRRDARTGGCDVRAGQAFLTPAQEASLRARVSWCCRRSPSPPGERTSTTAPLPRLREHGRGAAASRRRRTAPRHLQARASIHRERRAKSSSGSRGCQRGSRVG